MGLGIGNWLKWLIRLFCSFSPLLRETLIQFVEYPSFIRPLFVYTEYGRPVPEESAACSGGLKDEYAFRGGVTFC
jgi:hypothetical protein